MPAVRIARHQMPLARIGEPGVEIPWPAGDPMVQGNPDRDPGYGRQAGRRRARRDFTAAAQAGPVCLDFTSVRTRVELADVAFALAALAQRVRRPDVGYERMAFDFSMWMEWVALSEEMRQ